MADGTGLTVASKKFPSLTRATCAPIFLQVAAEPTAGGESPCHTRMRAGAPAPRAFACLRPIPPPALSRRVGPDGGGCFHQWNLVAVVCGLCANGLGDIVAL